MIYDMRQIRGLRKMKYLTIAVALLACCSVSPLNAKIFAPGDDIWGIQVDGDIINVGVAGTAGGVNNWPGAEAPENAINGVGQKYLNFGKTNTGFITTPSAGSSIATSITLWTANDAQPRDPSGYQVWGTNVEIAGSGPFSLTDFAAISTGDITLPSSRNAGGDFPLLPENSLTVDFANTDVYASYLVVFPDVKDNPNANSMQIADVQLGGTIIPEPSAAALMLMGLAALGLVRRRK
jgi:hypothetical protein